MAVPTDTSAAAERLLIEGYRQMAPKIKLARVVALNRALVELATARLRSQYGAALTQRELRLRLAALHLDASTMREVFDWDPAIRGL
jgi:hypothetical protein